MSMDDRLLDILKRRDARASQSPKSVLRTAAMAVAMAGGLVFGQAGAVQSGGSETTEADNDPFAECARIQSDRERLACFDEALSEARGRPAVPAQSSAPQVQPVPSARQVQPDPKPAPVPAREPLRDREQERIDEFGSEQVSRFGSDSEAKARAKLEAEEPGSLRATVVEHGENAYGKAFVVLDNGQVWRATKGTRIRFHRDKPSVVTIERGWVGGYFLKVEGRSVKHRIVRVK